MRDYNYRKNWNDLLTPEIVKKLTLIHEYKGEQELKLPCLKRLPELTKKCKLANPVVQHIFSLSPDVFTKHILIPLDASFLF